MSTKTSSRVALISRALHRSTAKAPKGIFATAIPPVLYQTQLQLLLVTRQLRLHSSLHDPNSRSPVKSKKNQMALSYVERSLSWIFMNNKGHDELLFTKGPAFKSFPEPNIEVSANPAELTIEYTQLHSEPAKIPELSWRWDGPGEVKQYILVVEDPDSPSLSKVKEPSLHGLYYNIPGETTELKASDFEILNDGTGNESESKSKNGSKKLKLKGGFKVGKNRRGTVYTAPRPLLGHGPHRYMFELVALKEELDESRLSPVATKDELAGEIEGRVVGWGCWVGSFEYK